MNTSKDHPPLFKAQCGCVYDYYYHPCNGWDKNDEPYIECKTHDKKTKKAEEVHEKYKQEVKEAQIKRLMDKKQKLKEDIKQIDKELYVIEHGHHPDDVKRDINKAEEQLKRLYELSNTLPEMKYDD